MTKSELNDTSVTQVMQDLLITAGPLESISSIEKKLEDNNIHHIPIVDEANHLLGIITSSDIYILKDHGTKIGHESSIMKNARVLGSSLAKEIMSTGLKTVQTTDSVSVCIELLSENRFHAIPVMKDDQLVGIVTTFDLVMFAYN